MKDFNVSYGQDIFDIAIKVGYGMDSVYKLIRENPFIDSIDFDFDANPLRKVEYDENFKFLNAQIITQEQDKTVDPIRNLTARDRQTIFDLALMSVGLDNVYKLLSANNFNNINIAPKVGKVFNFSVNDVKDRGFYNRKFIITTGDIQDDAKYFLLQENGYYILQETNDKIIIES